MDHVFLRVFGYVFCVYVRDSEMFNTSRNRLDKVIGGMCRRCVGVHAKLIRLPLALNLSFQLNEVWLRRIISRMSGIRRNSTPMDNVDLWFMLDSFFEL